LVSGVTSIKNGKQKKSYCNYKVGEKNAESLFVRRRLSADKIYGIEFEKEGQQNLAFVEGPENFKAYEYSILVTDLEDDLLTIFYHYRDRADCVLIIATVMTTRMTKVITR